ncbi:6-phosphogluconate dehydrogenase [Frankia sp. CcI49]|uniref:NAD(P)-dependent oxidoreductase n=1 Tax=unclassified Frankia TaxID=2632575 RepID=UPI0006C9FDBD|nr:6-phosphogluconate dehydrogenase [Frankia sp. R43]ONH58777.1 6-phosphogluconate dehydrogenase [Frankia sp. CcI49]
MRVGFIGLGSQGAPMARRIVEDGFPLTLWARRSASTEPFADTAANLAATPAEVGASSDIVCVCVVGDADVEDVLLRPDGVLAGLAPGGLVVIHSTIHPDTCRRLADKAAKRGIAVVDAPVSGGGAAAAKRALLVMAGGAEEDVARCRPMLETFANPLIHLGQLGSGQLAKALNNFVFTAQLTVAWETFTLAEGLGMDPAAVAQVLAHGSGGSRAAGILAASGFNTTGLRQAATLLRKDVGIMLDVARTDGVTEPAALMKLVDAALSTLE